MYANTLTNDWSDDSSIGEHAHGGENAHRAEFA